MFPEGLEDTPFTKVDQGWISKKWQQTLPWGNINKNKKVINALESNNWSYF